MDDDNDHHDAAFLRPLNELAAAVVTSLFQQEEGQEQQQQQHRQQQQHQLLTMEQRQEQLMLLQHYDSAAGGGVVSTGGAVAVQQQQQRWLSDGSDFGGYNLLADKPVQAELEQAYTDKQSPIGIAATVVSNGLLFLLIFGLSATVDMRNLKRQLSNKFAIVTGVAMQFLIMPVLGFLAVLCLRDFGLTHAMAVTLLVVTSSPGGSYSNWWCSTFNAELALSVAMTTVSSVLSVALLPANLVLYTYLAFGVAGDDAGDEDILKALDFGALFLTLGLVIAAIVLGLGCGYKWDNPKFHVCANRLGSVAGLCLILFSFLLSSGADGAESNFWNQPWAFYVAVMFPVVVGLVLANFISRSLRLSGPETVAIAVECCYQNVGIATGVAITMYDDPDTRAEAVAIPLFYGAVEAVVIGLYCVLAWKMDWTKAPARERFCTVVSKTYEVPEDIAVDDEQHVPDEPSQSEHPDESLAVMDGGNRSRKSSDGDDSSSCVEEGAALSPGKDEDGKQVRRRRRGGNEIEGTGFWARAFPPVLRRLSSSFGFGGPSEPAAALSHEDQDDDGTCAGAGGCTPRKRFASPGSSDTDSDLLPAGGNRTRFVSSDFTAETSLCSGVSTSSPSVSPPTPTDHQQQQQQQQAPPQLIDSIPEASPNAGSGSSSSSTSFSPSLLPRPQSSSSSSHSSQSASSPPRRH